MKYLCILFLLLFSFSAIGNNIRVEGKTRVVEFLGNDTAVVEVTLLWDNSWRDDFNWDAAWIFFKYKKRGMSEGWKHVYLGRDGHEAIPLSGNEGGNYMFMFGEAGVGSSAKVTGLYVIRDEISEGKVKARLRVKWPLSTNGLTKSDFGENMDQYYIAVHAIEMVYIPYGAYSLGDGFSGKSFVNSGKEPLTIDSEDGRSVYTLSSPSTPFSLPSSYPKGYAGFYVMKYEVSQEQYVEFLNSLTLSQQKSRVGNNDFEHMEKGDYVFGDLKRASCRNGIAFISQSRKDGPAVFGNNLNRENDFFSVDDGQTLACNYLSIEDMLAYCDWSGLRPMSELEYEKACRRPYPQVPEKGEYAWNTSSGVNSLQSESELSYRWSENEQAVSKQKNVNSGGHLNGPVRCGLFATSSTSQSESGATYWGVMEMGGNLWEMCYNAESAGSKFVGNDFNYSHGDGVLDVGGNTDISASYWPFVVGAIGVRGGSFSSVDSLLRTSDRSYAAGTYFTVMTQRDSTVGFRAARGVLNTTGFTAGEIYCINGLLNDTLCSGMEYTIQGTPAERAIGKTLYNWYVSEDEGISWNLVEGESELQLNYKNFNNSTSSGKSYLFKRKAICAVGEAITNTISLYVLNPVLSPIKGNDYITYNSVTQYNAEVFNSDNLVWQFSWETHKLQGPGSGELTIDQTGLCQPLMTVADTSSLWRIELTAFSEKCSSLKQEKQVKIVICPYNGPDLYMDVHHQCIQRMTGGQNWEAWIKDERDGELYRIVEMPDHKWWFAEELRSSLQTNGGCIAGDCSKYGRWYTWNQAMNGGAVSAANPSGRQGICPAGWHLPSLSEWTVMMKCGIGNCDQNLPYSTTNFAKMFATDYNVPGYQEWAPSGIPGSLLGYWGLDLRWSANSSDHRNYVLTDAVGAQMDQSAWAGSYTNWQLGSTWSNYYTYFTGNRYSKVRCVKN